MFTLTASTLGQFSSGSTGADGALDTSTMNCPGQICLVQLPESGILNYTTINISSGRALVFRPNSRNTPAILLAQSSVTIVGQINVSNPCGIAAAYPFSSFPCSGNIPSHSSNQTPGVGGFSGGAANGNGYGAGGGIYQVRPEGRWVGPLSLVPIVGGSGGAGYCGGGCIGSGGGGAVVIASSAAISISGSVVANGGGGEGSGSGGAIRLIANTISVSGVLQALSYPASNLNVGIIRIEATDFDFTGSSTPLAIHSTINPNIFGSSVPRLSISTVGGFSVPASSGARFDLIDLVLPNQLPDPVNVGITALNIPTGTQVQVGFVSGSPSGTSTPCNLAGSFASSSCTATISNLNRSGGTYLLATAMFDPPASLAKFNPKGPNQVTKVKLESVLGANPRYVFLRSNGTVIETAIISKEFLKEFGM